MVHQKHMKAFRIVTNIAVAGGLGLYVVAVVSRVDRFSWNLVITVLVNFLPYVFCLVIDRIMNRSVMAACSSILLLTVDLWLFRDIIDSHSFSGVPIIFYDIVVPRLSPLLKLVIILPSGCLAGFLVEKYCHGTPNSHPPGDEP